MLAQIKVRVFFLFPYRRPFLFCVVYWHLVWVRTFDVMFDYVLSSLLAHKQNRRQATNVNKAVNFAIADDQLCLNERLCRYVWVNVLTLIPSRVLERKEKNKRLKIFKPICNYLYQYNHTSLLNLWAKF